MIRRHFLTGNRVEESGTGVGSQRSEMNGRDLIKAGWREGPLVGMALTAAKRLRRDGLKDAEIITLLNQCRVDPTAFVDDDRLGLLARRLEEDRSATTEPGMALRPSPLPYPIWGADLIDQAALEQMDTAMRLPVSRAGALMADAHVGYGLPIGGVLQTVNAVIPYAVGSDIACRMRLTVVDVPGERLEQDRDRLKRALVSGTVFGAGKDNPAKPSSPVLDADWSLTPFLRGLRDTARKQLGTSGSGNHFVEWGAVEWRGKRRLALMSHSGSRGVGFKIADYYSKAAEKRRRRDLPPEAIRLAWLDLESELGREYWMSMELAGQFASENHRVIHDRVVDLAGLSGDVMHVVENHHNFAWKEERDGSWLVTHRKGATPAGPGVEGVIPGSMASPGFVVSGKGNRESLESASHGAGRRMGRRAATRELKATERDELLEAMGVTLIGGGLDESPQAYKPIELVMEAQRDLVEVTGAFTPAIVRMDTGSRDI